MIRQWKCVTLLTFLCAVWGTSTVLAQQGQTGAAGGATAGSASTLSSAQGYGLDARFGGSGFDTYTQGSSALGTTTAGARAGTAGFGQTGGGVTGRANLSTGGMGRMGGFGGLGNMGGLGFGGMGGMFGFGRNMFGQNQQGAQGNRVIRTRSRLGFAPPTPAASAITASYQKVITRVLQRDDYGGGSVNVTMEGQVAVLTGTVETDHARDVAERLALLEPGIGEVRNELLVRAAEPTPGTSPRATVGGQPR